MLIPKYHKMDINVLFLERANLGGYLAYLNQSFAKKVLLVLRRLRVVQKCQEAHVGPAT